MQNAQERSAESLGGGGGSPSRSRAGLDIRAGNPPLVAICIPTFRRPATLHALLESLGKLTFSVQRPSLLFVIIDNDEMETARVTVESIRGQLRREVVYVVEPVRNIAGARNRGVSIALERGAEWVAFIDDDEVADPRWLDELLAVQRRYGAEVVGGPVLPRYAADVPQWVREGGFFEPRRYPTGTQVEMVHTNNSLVNRSLLQAPDGPFDPAFGVSGGSDTQFFLRLRRAGVRLIWADEALVEEAVAPHRARLQWILMRALRVGNSYVFCERTLPGQKWRRSASLAGGAAARLSAGILLSLLGLLRGRSHLILALRKIYHAAGAFAALAGLRYHEYRRPVGADGNRNVHGSCDSSSKQVARRS